jgi:hypothetical protein
LAGRADVDPVFLEGVVLRIETPPRILRRTKDELALLLVGEVGAAGEDECDAGQGDAAKA